MALPNLNRPSSVLGKNATQAVSTSATAIVSNGAASGKSLRIVSLYVANVDGTNSAEVTAEVYDGSAGKRICSTVTVPADATVVLVSKEEPIYLVEGDSLRLTASANNDLEAVCSYEEIS